MGSGVAGWGNVGVAWRDWAWHKQMFRVKLCNCQTVSGMDLVSFNPVKPDLLKRVQKIIFFEMELLDLETLDKTHIYY